MEKIGVLLANCPQIRELIDGEEDMEVLREVSGQFDVLIAMDETKADAVILGMADSKVPGLSSHLLARYPNLTILCLTSKGEIGCIVVDASNPTIILRTLRQTVQAHTAQRKG